MTIAAKPPLGAPPVFRECVFYWAARAALSLNFILGDSAAKDRAMAQINEEFRKTPLWSLGNTSILSAAVMLSPTAIAFQTAPHEPVTHITAKSEIQTFEAAYLHPLALCALFGGLDEVAAKFGPKPTTAKTPPKAAADQAPEDLDASTFQPLPSDPIGSPTTAPPAMADAFATHPSPPVIDASFIDSQFLNNNLEELDAGFEFLSITLAHDPNAYLESLGAQDRGAPHIAAADSPFSHIVYEIRIYRGIIPVIRILDTRESRHPLTAEYLLTLGKSPLVEIRQLNPSTGSPKIFFAAFRLFFAAGAVTIQYQDPFHGNAVIQVWIDEPDLRIRCRTHHFTREIRITDSLLREAIEAISAVVHADPVKACGVLPDLMTFGAWLFHTTTRIPRARLLLDIDPAFQSTKSQDARRPKAQFRHEAGFNTFNRILEFQSDLFFNETTWPHMLPLNLLRALRMTLYVPLDSDLALPADIDDIGEDWADLLHMGETGQTLVKALAVIPAKGKWTNPIPIPKIRASAFRSLVNFYHLTVPIADVRLRFDYAAALAKVWASLHTSRDYIQLSPERVDAALGEPVALSLAGLGLKTLPPCIAELDTLEVLDLSNNRLTHVPAWLAALPRLRKLNLAHNRIKSLEPLYATPWIREIICDNNPLADFTAATAESANNPAADIQSEPKEKTRLPAD
jgi:hypothetical protein